MFRRQLTGDVCLADLRICCHGDGHMRSLQETGKAPRDNNGVTCKALQQGTGWATGPGALRCMACHSKPWKSRKLLPSPARGPAPEGHSPGASSCPLGRGKRPNPSESEQNISEQMSGF